MTRPLLTLLVASNLLLAAYVIFQSFWAGAGLSAFCDDQARMLSAIDTKRWSELSGNLPLPTTKSLIHSADMFSGNRIARIMLVTPLILVFQAAICSWLLVRSRPTIPSPA
ncbi:MAG: hypothetical protein KF691_10810 [Phycisphaeraceae bacterium]|nr:hypothetical protein [Phycisphaeraceae bacterium]